MGLKGWAVVEKLRQFAKLSTKPKTGLEPAREKAFRGAIAKVNDERRIAHERIAAARAPVAADVNPIA